MAEERGKAGRLPPEWFRRVAWRVHRAVYRLTFGRLGLWKPKPDGWGALRLTATGRRSGRERSVMLGYFEEGPALVTLAMNGWMEGEPAWFLNLLADPEATVEVRGGAPRRVRAHVANGDERERLWERWRAIDTGLDDLASQRSQTAVVVFEPVTTG